MDKIVGRFNVRHATVLSLNDAMNNIVSEEPTELPLNVETNNNMDILTAPPDIPPVQHPSLNVETLDLKQCHVCITPLESIVFDDPDMKPSPASTEKPNVLPVGEHYTRSRTRKRQSCCNQIPRKASSCVQYGETDESEISARKRKPVSIKPRASGPSETCVTAQKLNPGI